MASLTAAMVSTGSNEAPQRTFASMCPALLIAIVSGFVVNGGRPVLNFVSSLVTTLVCAGLAVQNVALGIVLMFLFVPVSVLSATGTARTGRALVKMLVLLWSCGGAVLLGLGAATPSSAKSSLLLAALLASQCASVVLGQGLGPVQCGS